MAFFCWKEEESFLFGYDIPKYASQRVLETLERALGNSQGACG